MTIDEASSPVATVATRPLLGKTDRNRAASNAYTGIEQHPRNKCPAKDATCHKCQMKGHYSTQCFVKNIDMSSLDAAFLNVSSLCYSRLHESAGATLNTQKCEFSKTYVTFLGHMIDHTGSRD